MLYKYWPTCCVSWFQAVLKQNLSSTVLKYSTVQYSAALKQYSYLKRVVAWMLCFIYNSTPGRTQQIDPLTVHELELCLWLQVQSDDFLTEKCTLHNRSQLPKKSCLRTLHPILEESGLLRVAGRVHNSHFSFSQRHPVFLDGKHPLTKLIIRAEHICLLHTGPTLVLSSFGRSLHIIRQCKRCLHNYTCLYYLLAYDC